MTATDQQCADSNAPVTFPESVDDQVSFAVPIVSSFPPLVQRVFVLYKVYEWPPDRIALHLNLTREAVVDLLMTGARLFNRGIKRTDRPHGTLASDQGVSK